MKSSTKTWLIAAAVLVLLGIVSFVGILALNHWDLPGLTGTKGETTMIDVKETFRNIDIRTVTADIRFVPSADGTCRATHTGPSGIEFTAVIENDTLKIETSDSRKWYERIALWDKSSEITVTLPEGSYGSLRIEGSTGDIEIPGALFFESASVSTSTGDVSLGASVSGAVTIGTSTGDITLGKLSAGSLALSASTGHVKVSSVEASGDVRVDVTTGKTVLTDVTCHDLVSSGSTGDIELKNVVAAGQFSLERSTGDIELDGCDAGEILIETTTGEVKGTLLSEKIFITKSVTGDVKVPESVTGGRCVVTTTTGDITLSFR